MDRLEFGQPVAMIRSSALLALGRLTREDATSAALRQHLELIVAEARRVETLPRPDPAPRRRLHWLRQEQTGAASTTPPKSVVQ